MSQALAVARYTLIEMTRRRLLVVIVVIGVVLMGGTDASGAVDIWFWFAYVVAISVLLFWSVRRKQV